MRDFNLKPTSSILKSINLTKKHRQHTPPKRAPITNETLIKVTLSRLYADNQHIKNGIKEQSYRQIQYGLFEFLKDLSTALKLSEEQSPLLRDLIKTSLGKLATDYQPMLKSFHLSLTSIFNYSSRSFKEEELTNPLLHRIKSFVHEVDQAFLSIESNWNSGVILDMEA